MDMSSSSADQFINEGLPYQSLHGQLRTLTEKHEDEESAFRLTSDMRHEIRFLQQELRFQQMIFMLLQNHGVMSETLNNIRSIAETEAAPIEDASADWENMKISSTLNAFQGLQESIRYFKRWRLYVSQFLKTIDQKVKPDLKEFCVGIADRLLQGNSPREYDIVEFIDIIRLKLKDLVISRPDITVPVKKQMETLEDILRYVCIIAGKETNLDQTIQKFLEYFWPCLNFAAVLVILHWVDEEDEEHISPLLQKFKLSNLQLVGAYIVVIKALKPSNVSEILVMREAVGRFTNMVLENLFFSTDDHFEMLEEGLALWIALLVDPPQSDEEDEKLICAQTNLLVDKAESLIRSLCCLDKLGEDTAERRNILNDLLEKMNEAKAEIRQLHVEIPGLPWTNTNVEIPGLPRTNVPLMNGWGFFDFMLGNLQKKLEHEADMFPFEKHLITIVHKELLFLRPFLMDIFELREEYKELRDIWVQSSDMVYLVDYVTDSCLSSIEVPIWSTLMHLSNEIEKVRFVKTEVSKFIENQMYKHKAIHAKVNSKVVIPAKVNSKGVIPRQEQDYATTKDSVMVGFANEKQRLIDQLISGTDHRDVVAIVGMAGQGKTTLAQSVFQDPYVKAKFHMCSWCCISQAYDTKEILLEILKNFGNPISPNEFYNVTENGLKIEVYQRLKGRKYLIVLDDIWDAEAWHELQVCLPDDNIRSRILLTSQSHNVAFGVGVEGYRIVELQPLSSEESWNLFQIEVFKEHPCPPTLSIIGKKIAENCKGLPLAIVVVAGLLKKSKNVDSWKQISESQKSQFRSEGYMSILELSYNHLPDYLKPCFLYMGAFQEDQMIDAKRLIQFWIVEGFIQNDGMRSREDVAYEYLMDLVSRSLVLIAQRSSRYRIKKCRVHDLLRELCLIKANEERFLLVPNVSDHLFRIRNNHYRLFIHGKWKPLVDSKPIVLSVRSLLVSGGGRCHYLKRFKLLRVLDLSYALVRQTDFDEITNLIHLRFLSVACLFAIPSSIANLFRLEVLHLRCFGMRGILPSAVMKMASLRHIFAGKCRIEYTEDFDKVMLKLCPPLINLKTLTSLDLGEDEESFTMVAQKLPNILKLGLRLSFCVPLSSYFKELESLNLCILRRLPETEAISPFKLAFPLTLKKLNLTAESPLSGTMMSSIGKLSNLEVLKLNVNFEGKRWDVEEDEFLKLKYLALRSSSIQEWNISDDSFYRLEQLVVKNCNQLRELHPVFGEIYTLQRIEVSNCCNSLTYSVRQIVETFEEVGIKIQFSISETNPEERYTSL